MADRQDASRPDTVADVVNAAGAGPFVLACEHASNHVPAGFGNLGLDEAALRAHIAWDPGALAVASELARLLDVPLVAQRVSRLLYDCNRPPESADSVPETSEVYTIPGNQRLSAAQRADRATRFYHPFRTLLAETIERKVRCGPDPVLVTIHSFTPIYFGMRRDVELGVLHDQDRSFADPVPGTTAQDVGRRNDSGDYSITTTFILLPADMRAERTSALALRFGTRLPTTDNRVGIERDQTDFFAFLAGRHDVGRVRLFAETGVGIHGTREPSFEQSDVLVFIGGATFAASPIEPTLLLTGHADGIPDRAIRGNEELAELRLRVRSAARPGLEVELIRGLSPFSPSWGLGMLLVLDG